MHMEFTEIPASGVAVRLLHDGMTIANAAISSSLFQTSPSCRQTYNLSFESTGLRDTVHHIQMLYIQAYICVENYVKVCPATLNLYTM